MKRLALLLFFAAISANAQTVTLSRVAKAEKLTTTDSVAASKPCNGITENLALTDGVGAIARTPAFAALQESAPTSDVVAIAFTFTFPKKCSLSMLGNVVTCLLSGGP